MSPRTKANKAQKAAADAQRGSRRSTFDAGSGVSFKAGAAVDYTDSRWPGHIVAVEEKAGALSPRTPYPSSKRYRSSCASGVNV